MVAGGFNLGDAHGRVIIDGSSINADIANAQRAFDGATRSMGQGLQSLGSTVSRVGDSLTLLTAPLLGFMGTGIKTAATFEASMTEISARTGLVGEGLERVRQAALDFGADTVFSAQQSADAFLQLLSSGQTYEEALATLPMVLEGAAASGAGLGRTADTLTDIMATFNLRIDRLSPSARRLATSLGITNEALVKWSMQGDEISEIPPEFERLAESMEMSAEEFYGWLNRTEDASTVIESLTRASGASSATIDSLTEGFAAGGAVMAMFGMSVDQSAAALAVLEERGIKGANAGTAIRSMLLNMAEDTVPTKAAWAELGVSMYNTDGTMRNMQSVLYDLDVALDKLPLEEQNRLMQQLAGSYGIGALAALRNGHAIADMQGLMEEQSSATEVAATMMGTFKVRTDSLKGSLETLQIEVLTPLIENTLTPLIERLTGVVNKVTDWVKANPELTSKLVLMAGSLALVGPAAMIAGRGISALGVVVGALMGPLGLILGVVAGLAYAWESNFLGIRDTVVPILTEVGEFIGQFVQDIRAGIDPLTAIWRGVIMSLGFDAGVAFQGIIAPIQAALDSVGRAIAPIVNAIRGFFNDVSSGTPIMAAIFSAIQSAFGHEAATQFLVFRAGVEDVIGAIVNLAGQFIGTLGRIWETIRPSLEAVWGWFTQTALPGVVNFVSNTVLPIIEGFFNYVARFWEIVSPALEAVYTWFFESALPAIVAFIENIVVPGIEYFIGILADIWSVIGPALESVFEWFMTTGLPGIVSFITDTVIPAVTWFTDLLATIWETVGPHLRNLFNWFRDVFRTIGETFIRPVIDFIEGAIGKVQELIRTLQSIPGTYAGAAQNAGTIAAGVASGQFNIGDVLNAAGNAIGAEFAPGRDSGGPGRAFLPYLIGRPQIDQEVFVPRSDGQFIPNMRQEINETVAAALGRHGGAGGLPRMTVNIYANDYEGGQAAARGFNEEFMEVYRR